MVVSAGSSAHEESQKEKVSIPFSFRREKI
jgi:hypothetical protein